jgi:hypothetical protein
VRVRRRAAGTEQQRGGGQHKRAEKFTKVECFHSFIWLEWLPANTQNESKSTSNHFVTPKQNCSSSQPRPYCGLFIIVAEDRRERSAAFRPLQHSNFKRAKGFMRLVKLKVAMS